MSGAESVAALLEHLKAGDDAAAQRLWEQFYPELVALARRRLRTASRRVADEEDVALSAFDSFCAAARQGRLPDLRGRDNLWAMLVRITACKAADLLARQKRKKRGGGRVRGDSALAAPGDGSGAGGFDAAPGDDPTPALAVQLAEEVERLLTKLAQSRDPQLRQIAVWKMEGHDNAAIAQMLSCSIPTVERRLRLIRTILADA